MLKNRIFWGLNNFSSIDLGSCIQEEIKLLVETSLLLDDGWEEPRFRLLVEIFFYAVKIAKNPAVTEHVLVPCLNAILKITSNPPSNTHPTGTGVAQNLQLHDWLVGKINLHDPLILGSSFEGEISREERLAKKYVDKWKRYKWLKARREYAWLKELLFSESSLTIRFNFSVNYARIRKITPASLDFLTNLLHFYLAFLLLERMLLNILNSIND